MTSTTDGPRIETKYSGAPAGVCPGARLQARVGGDRARRRLRSEALTSGLQLSPSSIAFADFTRKGWRARSNGSFPWSRSWLLEACGGPVAYAGRTKAPSAPRVLLPMITAWGLLISARKALKPIMQGTDSGATAGESLRLTITGIWIQHKWLMADLSPPTPLTSNLPRPCKGAEKATRSWSCLLYTSPSPRD